MKARVVKLYILLPADVEGDGEVADYVSSIMSEQLVYNGEVLDWEYVDHAKREVTIPDGGWDADQGVMKALTTNGQVL